MSLPKTFTAGERLFAADLNDNFQYFDEQLPAAQNGQVLTFNSTSGKWEAKDLKMKEKRIARFTGGGTWTVPAGVTYAIAHMLGGGGGIGTGAGGNGGNSSVAFASGTVSSTGGRGQTAGALTFSRVSVAGAANSGKSASIYGFHTAGDLALVAGNSLGNAGDSQYIVAGAAVTPAASITVAVGNGGTAGTNGAAGGSGYVYIEYYEEV